MSLRGRIFREYMDLYVNLYGNWRIRTNKVTDELTGHDDIVSFVKSLRIRWLGHVED
jgi:hypothetical protein